MNDWFFLIQPIVSSLALTVIPSRQRALAYLVLGTELLCMAVSPASVRLFYLFIILAQFYALRHWSAKQPKNPLVEALHRYPVPTLVAIASRGPGGRLTWLARAIPYAVAFYSPLRKAVAINPVGKVEELINAAPDELRDALRSVFEMQDTSPLENLLSLMATNAGRKLLLIAVALMAVLLILSILLPIMLAFLMTVMAVL